MSQNCAKLQARLQKTDSVTAEREIWIVNRHLAHYRLPVLDRLAERVQQKGFTLRFVFDPTLIIGPAEQTRPYFDPFISVRDCKVFGFECWRLSGLLKGIRLHRPAAVIVEGTPRIITNLLVPAATRATGGVCLLWSKGHIEPGTPSGYFTDLIRFRFAKLFDGVICYGEEGKRDLERIGIPSESITVARNTIDTDRIFAESADRDVVASEFKRQQGLEGRHIVLYCGTLYPKKRHLDLVEAWPAIHAANPDAVLVMVGGGPMLGEVKARAAELGSESIRILGSVGDGEDYSWIGACDVSVMCGGLGLAIQQTLAFGRPMVVADESGVDGEIVRDGETGWRYPKGDVNALANVVNAVLADPVGSAAIGRRGQDLVRNEVNIDGMVRSLVTALERSGVLPKT
ncbi:MAG: glycosyltransferase family 4 protein [Mycolicibacterium sp.]|uniref:glycosyltransferase family 4 protein n=1 Tax=Mycolicibacterium sp. TaxID=2320850 RepID=UPI003D116649